jgi:hypothetical protein
MKNKHFKWMVHVIKSCITLDQLQNCENLVQIYFDKYNDQLDRFMLNKCVGDTMNRIIMNRQIN